jgi:hypothetical protein
VEKLIQTPFRVEHVCYGDCAIWRYIDILDAENSGIMTGKDYFM